MRWIDAGSGEALAITSRMDDRIHAEMTAWTEGGGEIVETMSALLVFVAGIEAVEARLTPGVSATIGRSMASGEQTAIAKAAGGKL